MSRENEPRPESPKLPVLRHFGKIAKALGHEYRLILLELLSQGEQSVEVLAERCHQPVANVSQHLGHLRRAGLVASRPDGRHVRYRLADRDVLTLLAALQNVGERQLATMRDTVDLYYRQRDRLEPVSAQELKRRLGDESVVVLDVRPDDEFAQGHVPGAINIPYQELRERLHELPDDRDIVAYCRGPYCVMAFEAVIRLRRAGRRARRLKEGFPNWVEAGLPLETGG